MDLSAVLGHWRGPGGAISFVASGDDYLVLHPGTPSGFEPRLVAVDDHSVKVIGGPFNGGVVTFDVADQGLVTHGLIGGMIPLDRIDTPPEPEPGSGLLPPPMVADPTRDARFGALLREALSRGVAGTIDYRLADPKHEFVRYVLDQGIAIFHGSNRTQIDEFVPVRESLELGDHGGRGNVGGVYGTHDPLWAMFFAVIDRDRLKGSIRNGVTTYDNPAGQTVDVYNFSIHHELLTGRPFTSGMLYLLPRDRFERLPFYPHGPLSNEWVCTEPVRPLAKLPVDPDDFPFLEDIGGHDDGELIAFGDLAGKVYEGLVSAERIAGGFSFITTTSRSIIDDFVAMSQRWYPDVEREVEAVPEGTRLENRGPEAFLQSLERRLAPALD